MDQQTYRKLISGHGSWPLGFVARIALTVLSWPYALVVGVRNALYSAGWLPSHTVGAPVLCVGNLTTGGTGKTPLVAWLARVLADRGLQVAILTRGYKTDRGALSDEPAELAMACPGTAVVVNPDRVAGAAEAIGNHGAQVLLMDDGFQHRRLARDLDILAIDATVPFGYGRLLPAGLLREGIGGLKRAHAVVITRCDLVAEEQLSQIEQQIGRINPDLAVARSIHAPTGLRTPETDNVSLDELRNKKIFAFCGLGNPDAFFDTLRRTGGSLVGTRTFDDHHAYTPSCLEKIHQQAKTHGADLILTSAKDWTKITRLNPPGGPPEMACLVAALQFIRGRDELTTLIERTLAGRIGPS